MRIHRVEVLVDDYQFLAPDFPDTAQELAFERQFDNGRRLGAEWRPPPLYVPNPLLPQPDVTRIFGVPALVFTPSVVERTVFVLQAAGELLPLPFQELELQLLNLTTMVGCLDRERSEWKLGKISGKPVRVLRYQFLTRRLPEATLFRFPEESATIYTISGRWGPDEEFKPLYDDLGLTGLRFTEVWNDEE